MKKIFSLLIGSTMILSSVTPVFALGINEIPQSVYDISKSTSIDEIYQNAYNIAKKETRKSITDDYSAYSYLLNNIEQVSISNNQVYISNINVSSDEESILNDFIKRLNVLLELDAIEVNSDLSISKKEAPKLDELSERKVHEFEVMRDCRRHADELLEVFDNAIFGTAHVVAGAYFAERVKYGGVWDYKEYLGTNTEYYEPELKQNMTGETIGNFHYGYVGRAVFEPWTLKSAAGFVQIFAGTSDLSYWDSYWDDPADTEDIEWGISYYELEN